ncbi:MAG TPA: hypothetical protein ENK25_04020 [Bacteroidetes bacterium]|nr:hypothetical protein [Bacteroidota bacterium]
MSFLVREGRIGIGRQPDGKAELKIKGGSSARKRSNISPSTVSPSSSRAAHSKCPHNVSLRRGVAIEDFGISL